MHLSNVLFFNFTSSQFAAGLLSTSKMADKSSKKSQPVAKKATGGGKTAPRGKRGKQIPVVNIQVPEGISAEGNYLLIKS